ncbi:MAG TPA: rhodanese-like domain-containing protein [Chitinophagaceae bacterium]|jgi:rhodanese-related sulfurtransferase|nr:rhodanese-like domain-containing protein [Chitinophagaceae bacterium]
MKSITVEELKQKMDAGEKVQLIDVREPHESAEFSIGGRLVPLGKVQTMQVEELEDLKEEDLYIYCRSGRRSMMACMVLEQLGFKEPTNVEGGMLAWQERIR